LEQDGANGGLELSADPVVAGVLLRTAALVAGLALVAEQRHGGGSSLALSAAAVSASAVRGSVGCGPSIPSAGRCRGAARRRWSRLWGEIGDGRRPAAVGPSGAPGIGVVGARVVGLNGALRF
jgi:hypothetical protein